MMTDDDSENIKISSMNDINDHALCGQTLDCVNFISSIRHFQCWWTLLIAHQTNNNGWNFVNFYGGTCVDLLFYCQINFQIFSTLNFETFVFPLKFIFVRCFLFIWRWSRIQPISDHKFMDFFWFSFVLSAFSSLEFGCFFLNLETLNLMLSLHGWPTISIKYNVPKWSTSFEWIIFGIIA